MKRWLEEVIIPFIRHIKVIYGELGLELIYSLAVSRSPDVEPGLAVFISGCHLETTKDEDMGEAAQVHPSYSQALDSNELCPGTWSAYLIQRIFCPMSRLPS